MKLILLLLLFGLHAFIGYGQTVDLYDNDITKMSLQELEASGKILINKSLIKSLQEYKDVEGYVCFSDIYYGFKGRDRVDFLNAYVIADLEYESLTEIRNKVLEANEGMDGMIYHAKIIRQIERKYQLYNNNEIELCFVPKK